MARNHPKRYWKDILISLHGLQSDLHDCTGFDGVKDMQIFAINGF